MDSGGKRLQESSKTKSANGALNGGIVVNGVFAATGSSEATGTTGEKPPIGSGGDTRVGKKKKNQQR